MRKTYQDMEALVRRMERVESQHRRIKSLSGVLDVVLLAVVLMGAQAAMQDGQFRKITAYEVTIVDSMGKPRVQIGTSDEGTGIRILNAKGKRIVGLGLPLDEEGSGLMVADNEGVPRIGLGMDQGIPSIAMTNEAGKKVIGLGGNADGYGLVVMSAEEVAQAILTATLKRKRDLVLTREGKLAHFLNKWVPGVMDTIVYNHMAKEKDSPFK